MTPNDEARLTAAIEQIHEMVGRLLERIDSPLPHLMNYQRAAMALGVSVSKLKTLVSDREINPVKLGGRRMIPLREIERVSTPRLRKSGASGSPPGTRDGRADAEAFRTMLKRRHGGEGWTDAELTAELAKVRRR